MNEKEVEAMEKAIEQLDDVIASMKTEVTEIQLSISNLEDIRRRLIAKLPTDNRFNHLFH